MAFFFGFLEERSTILSETDIADLVSIRRDLHAHPEVSGAEVETAQRIAGHLEALGAAQIITGLGGHGVAGLYRGPKPGPRLLFRCELDALPIRETDRPHMSHQPGTAHLCGHDGHMAILLGLARLLQRRPPARGQAVLLFQPAEETGAGGPAVVADARFAEIRPDQAYALHNMPGLPLGTVGLTTGPVASASRGMAIALSGHEAHSAEPENANSPGAAMAGLMTALPGLSWSDGSDFWKVTLTHARLGQPNFGITPGQGEVYATLRTRTNAGMAALVSCAENLVQNKGRSEGFGIEITYHEVFEHLENAPGPVDDIARAAAACDIRCGASGGTMGPSEDFAAFSHVAPSAMFFLGAGEDHPPLHRPDYDFPDTLIPIGARIFERVLRDRLG